MRARKSILVFALGALLKIAFETAVTPHEWKARRIKDAVQLLWRTQFPGDPAQHLYGTATIVLAFAMCPVGLLKDPTGENRAREGIHDRDYIKWPWQDFRPELSIHI